MFLLRYGWTTKMDERLTMPKKLTARVQQMLDSSAKNLKRGKASPPINLVLSKPAKTVEPPQGGRDTRAHQLARSHTMDSRLEEVYARGRIVRKKMLAAEGGSIFADQAAERLRISRTTLLRRYRNGRVLGWKEPGEAAVHFPVWQFKGRELLPGLPEVLSALVKGCAQLDDMGRIGFFLCQFGFLGRRRPLDLLRKGQIGDALLAAQAFTQA